MEKVNTKHDNAADERRVLLTAAKESSRRAREASLALGLTVKSLDENGYIIETLPNGQTRKIRKIEQTPIPRKGLKKGTTLCRK